MNAVNNHYYQAQGAMGMILVGFGALDVTKGAPRSCLTGISTALGSAAMIASFYQTHKFKKEDGRYNYANIAMLAFISLSLFAFNAAYVMGPSAPRPDFCDTNPTNWMCQPDQPRTPNFGKATKPLGG